MFYTGVNSVSFHALDIIDLPPKAFRGAWWLAQGRVFSKIQPTTICWIELISHKKNKPKHSEIVAEAHNKCHFLNLAPFNSLFNVVNEF